MDETDIADFKLPIEEYNYVKLIFKREGVYVIPYPTDYKTDKEIAVDAFSFTPSAEAVRTSAIAMKECLGILAVKLGAQ